MLRSRIFRWFLFVPAALLAAAATPAAAQQSSACDSAVSNPTGPVSAPAGQTFGFRLDSNHTTGYSWIITQPPNSAVADPLDMTYIEPQQGLPGAGGQDCFTFSAAAPGSTSVELAYRRPFEPNAPPGKTGTVMLVVTGAASRPVPAQVPAGDEPSVDEAA
jgi:inhibitor of cysteine peptidase